MDCGNGDIRVLTFDHLEPAEKDFNISKAVQNGTSWERIQAEIAKCEIVCHNCHAIRTSEQFGWHRALW